MVSGAMQLK
jgi:hypothetical protein